MLVPFDILKSEFCRVLLSRGMDARSAEESAMMFAMASADGVHTHGLNRFFAYVGMIDGKTMDLGGRPRLVSSSGALEIYDACRGPGNLNALFAIDRATMISEKHTISLVALRNNTHWMRPGYYGLRAAERKKIAILFTNTCPNMPAWGGDDPRIGNNPLVIAVPGRDHPFLLDIAMSMFSYGKLEKLAMERRQCLVDGGLDSHGYPTRDPGKILESKKLFPIGFWKGSGLSIALDLMASVISGGFATKDIAMDCEYPCQIFITIDIARIGDYGEMLAKVEDTLSYVRSSVPLDPQAPVRCPGDGLFEQRRRSMQEGVYCDDRLYRKLVDM